MTDRSGVDESDIAAVTLMDANEAIRVRFLLTCLAPASGRLVGSWGLESDSGAPMGGGTTEGVPFSCE